MTQRKDEEPKTTTGRKKLTLGKETLKDLTANAGQANRVHGGNRVVCSEDQSSCNGCDTYTGWCTQNGCGG